MTVIVTLQDIKDRAASVVRQGEGDPEGAHLDEDRLVRDVIFAISDGSLEMGLTPVQAASALVLHLYGPTADHERWYA